MWRKFMNPDEIRIFSLVMPLCSLAGLCALARSNQTITLRNLFSAAANSALFGAAVAWLMISRVGYDEWPLITGVSILSGLGGTQLIEFALLALKARFERLDK